MLIPALTDYSEHAAVTKATSSGLAGPACCQSQPGGSAGGRSLPGAAFAAEWETDWTSKGRLPLPRRSRNTGAHSSPQLSESVVSEHPGDAISPGGLRGTRQGQAAQSGTRGESGERGTSSILQAQRGGSSKGEYHVIMKHGSLTSIYPHCWLKSDPDGNLFKTLQKV